MKSLLFLLNQKRGGIIQENLHFPMSTLLAISIAWPLLITSALAQWATDPTVNTPICNAAQDQMYPKIISDGAGGAILTWEDVRDYSDMNIYAQRINAAGVVQWTLNGAAVCDAPGKQQNAALASDGFGGAIIAWEDSRTVGQPADIYAQRINSAGVAQWAANGIPICTYIDYQYAPTVMGDGSGGAIIAWYENGVIFAQKINPQGVTQWTTDGISLALIPGAGKNLSLVTDGAGGAIFTWQQDQSGGLNDIYAQRIGSNGGVPWIYEVPITLNHSGYFPASTSDGSGGAIITWADFRDGVAYDIYAQRINASGVVQWTVGGEPICGAAYSDLNPNIVDDGSGGAVITWEDWRAGNSDIYAQAIDSTGTVKWVSDGVAVCSATGDQVVPVLDPDGSGGVVIAWGDKRNGIYGEIYAQKLDSSGVPQWASDGVAVCTAFRDQNTPAITSDGSGGAIITWGDDRNHYSSAFDIYAQKVNASGSLGAVSDVPQGSGNTPGFVLVQNFPNPFNPTTTIKYALPEDSFVQLKVYDLYGKEVAELVKGNRAAGRHEVEFSANSLPSGMYFCRIKAGDFIETRKITLLK